MATEEHIIKAPRMVITGLRPPILPQDLITDILLRLPVKSLLKFRCVCKSWLFIISGSEFAKEHLKFSSPMNKGEPQNLLVGRSTKLGGVALQSFDLDSIMRDDVNYISKEDSHKVPKYFRFIGSCNGLICILISTDETTDEIFLWNPSIRKSKLLPEPDSTQFGRYPTYGFGYDDATHDYKVLRTCRDKHSTSIEIYSLTSNSWREILNYSPDHCFFYHGLSIFVNGAFHWYANRPNRLVSRQSRTPQIISLNLRTETYGEVLRPPDAKLNLFRVTVFGGCLCLVYGWGAQMDVWIMKEYGVRESWTKLVSILDDAKYRSLPSRSQVPLYMSATGIVLVRYASAFRLYDSNNNIFNREKEFKADLKFQDAITYHQSLVLLNSYSEGEKQPWQCRSEDAVSCRQILFLDIKEEIHRPKDDQETKTLIETISFPEHT